MSDVEDLGSMPLEDTKDNGREPRGMQVNHQDDDEGGQGLDGTNKEEEAENTEPGNVDSKITNANHKQKGGDGDGDGDQNDNEGEDEDEDEEGDDEDEDEDDEDEDDEDEDEDEDGEREARPRKKKRRMRANKYVDLEVEVDEDEEEEEDEGEAGFEAAEDYLERPGQRAIPIADRFEGDDDDLSENDRDHRNYERRVRDKEEAEAQRIAEEYKQRHRQRRGGMGIQAMQNFAPRSVLMPGVNDPNIWCIKCKIGRERELVMSISRKAIAQNLQISSAFQRDSFHGHLYVEARSEAHVKIAVEGLIGVYVSNVPILVPIEEMPDLLKSRKKQAPLQIGGWVRIKKGVYKGDLAQIDDVPESTDFVTLKVVPRIEMSPKEDQNLASASFDGKKRRRQESALFRPPPKAFVADAVREAYAGRAKVIKDAEGFHFMNELYADGYLIKDFKMHMIERENVNPTIDEIHQFQKEKKLGAAASRTDVAEGEAAADSATTEIDYNLLKEVAKAQTVLQPGDFVEIYEGSQKGISGTIESISNNILFLSPTDPEDLRGTTIEVLADQVRKKFKSGDHIKVLRGKNVNESGLVLKVKDDLITFLSDLSMEEITVFSKDVREAAEVGAAASAYGQYELHDLIQLDNETVGIIFKIEPDAFRILDQSGAIRTLRPSQIGNKLDTRMSVATDREGFEMRAGDMVKEHVQGNRDARTGRVLHVWRSLYAFLHNRDIVENGGVFVAYAKTLGSVAPRTVSSKFSADLTKMNPEVSGGAAMQSGLLAAAAAPIRGREVALGANVVVIKGNHKGLKGIIKDLNGPLARVELHTRMRTITIERNKLGVAIEKNGTSSSSSIQLLADWEKTKMDSRRSGSLNYSRALPSPHGSSRGSSGGYTPMQTPGGAYASGKTPMHRGNATPYGGGFGSATPFGAGSATPFGGYSSGKTPAYGGGGDAFNASSRTPYAGSGANAFSASSRTPYASGAGGGGQDAWGGATPYGNSNGSGSTSVQAGQWGTASPMYNPTANSSRVDQANSAWGSSSSGPWGSTSPKYSSDASSATKGPSALSAPSPWASEEPSAAHTPYASAPTPAAQTPYASAPTPAGQDDAWDSYDSAPTPAASHPTPYQSAATPADYEN